MTLIPVQPIDALPLLDRTAPSAVQLPVPGSVSFSQLLTSGIDRVNTDQIEADKMVRTFTLDDSIPVHQVTYALEQARLSLEMMLQMRSRLIEGYQQLMNMQL